MNEICLSCKKHTKCGRAEHETIGCGYYVPMTEQEYIQTCNTEQLAGWIFNILLICSRCGDESQSDKEKIKKCPFRKIGCTKKDWEMWLEQPHKEN